MKRRLAETVLSRRFAASLDVSAVTKDLGELTEVMYTYTAAGQRKTQAEIRGRREMLDKARFDAPLGRDVNGPRVLRSGPLIATEDVQAVAGSLQFAALTARRIAQPWAFGRVRT
jgi:hypothetical protein